VFSSDSRGGLLEENAFNRKVAYDQNPSGYHVRRIWNARLARVPGNAAQAIYSADRGTIDLSDDNADAG
jgi:hypothetical protein